MLKFSLLTNALLFANNTIFCSDLFSMQLGTNPNINMQSCLNLIPLLFFIGTGPILGLCKQQLVCRVVVVVLLFYIHGKHLRSCRDGQLT